MNNVFERTMVFLKKEYDLDAATPGTWKTVPATRIVQFKELDQTDREQHLFHFDIVALFAGKKKSDDDEDDQPKAWFDSHGSYDITTKFIKKFAITTETFTPEDKEELLNDSAAILDLALWLTREKLSPFFLKLRSK